MALCTPRAMRRRRRDSSFTNQAMSGAATSAISVSRQLRYRSQPSRPRIAMLSLIAMVITVVADAVTPDTS